MKVVEIPKSVTSDEIQALLERMVELAEESEITDIAVACMFRDKSSSTVFHIGFDPIGLLGALHVVQQRVYKSGVP